MSAFIQAIEKGKSGRSVLAWTVLPDGRPAHNLLPDWITEPHLSEPGRSPEHGHGDYYILDFSSALLASIAFDVPKGGQILDLCAAPGGKSVLLNQALEPSLLLSNDNHPRRRAALHANLTRCRCNAAWTTAREPWQFTEALPSSFDLVLVDAPCSGQSMYAKGEIARGAFHPRSISEFSRRQRLILRDAVPLLRPGGFLAYQTCTFSKEENEETIKWLMDRFDVEPVNVERLNGLQSPHATFPCCRVYPHRGLGAGGFSCLLRVGGDDTSKPIERSALEALSARQIVPPDAEDAS